MSNHEILLCELIGYEYDMKDKLFLWDSFEESASGHKDSSDQAYLEVRGDSVVLVKKRSSTDLYRVSNNSSSVDARAVSIKALTDWFKENGSRVEP